MRDRREKLLKLVCLLLAAGLAFQLARFIARANPTRGLVVPALPSLPASLQPDAGAKTNRAGITNVSSITNRSSTNLVSTETQKPNASIKLGTNAAGGADGSASRTSTNIQASGAASAAASRTSTSASNSTSTEPKQTAATNSQPLSASTNAKPEHAPQTSISSNLATLTATNQSTNVSTPAALKGRTNSANPFPGGMAGMPGFPGMMGKPAEIPADIKERVERITQGEILAPVIRPMPMALLGIGGEHAFLRSPEGQTGMVKEGEQVGTLKLLRIGTNRVLVEHEGEKKELTMFSGFGSDSLLPPKEKKPNETTNKTPDVHASGPRTNK